MTPSTRTTATPPLTDVHDMVVVHRAFRREFQLVPRLVRGVAAGDISRAAVIAAHIRLLLRGLELHHTSEDDLLWPKLLERAAPSSALILRMEGQHAAVHERLDRIEPALERWEAEARPAVSEELAVAFEGLWTALAEHLDDEERHILPIAARTITPAEWNALGEHGIAGMTKAQLPIMFGMVKEEADPEEQRELLSKVPFPIRILLRTVFARQYARYVRTIRG